MGQCLGACAGKVSTEDYMKMVEEVVLFLEGKTDILQRQLKQRMQEAAEGMQFELAAFYPTGCEMWRPQSKSSI